MTFLKDFYEFLLDSNFNEAGAKVLIVFIVLLILLCIPVFITLIFSHQKNKITGKSKMYLYAFSSGFFLVMALFGFMRESLEVSTTYGATWLATKNLNDIKSYQYLLNFGVVFGGFIVGLLFAFTVKNVIAYKINKKLLANSKMKAFVHDHSHDEHHSHDHPEFLFNDSDQIDIVDKVSAKLKIVALILLLTHRIPEGILLGYNLSLLIEGKNTSLTLTYFLSLIFHLIPEEIVFYYRLRESGYSTWKSLLLSFLGLSLFLPFMMLGIFIGGYLNHAWYLKAMFLSAIAGVFVFTSIVEFVPEFYHNKIDKKSLSRSVLLVFLGIITSALILIFHVHGQ